jgi:hypothetical protein
LDELKGAYDALLVQLAGDVADVLHRPGLSISELRDELRNSAGLLRDRMLEKKLRQFVIGIYRDDLGEREWIANLAMIIADGRPPSSWTDETLTEFGYSLKQVCGAFFRLLNLISENLEPRSAETSMYRVTVTDQTGKEAIKTVSATHSEVATAKRIVEEAVVQLAKLVKTDARSREIFMAILGGARSEISEQEGPSNEKESDGTQG